MVAVLWYALLLGQAGPEEAEATGSKTWTEFYRETAKGYQVTRADDGTEVPVSDRAVFDWASIEDHNGAVFAWTEKGRPALIATIFSFPIAGSKERRIVHEFASFTESKLTVEGANGTKWNPPPLAAMQTVPGAAPPPENANLLKSHCRRLAKDFSGHMNRRGERWDLRLLPTPLTEYRQSSEEVLGGGLFSFVGYSTDPEILLLIEARKGAKGPAWHFQPVRFSDKSLYLNYKDKPVWESVRKGHGANGPDTEDPHYRVLASERLSAEIVERLSVEAAKE